MSPRRSAAAKKDMAFSPSMELVPNEICMLCAENTAVLSPQCISPYLKFVHGTFFAKNAQALKQFQQSVDNQSMCALCAHKVVVANKFKDTYEDVCKRHTSFKKTRMSCLLCDSKTADIVQTESNPNNFSSKIKKFMESTLYPRPYQQCAICLDCLFYLHVWFEVNQYICNKFTPSIETFERSHSEVMASNQDIVNTPKPKKTVTFKEGKENITPPENSPFRRRQYSGNEFPITSALRKSPSSTTSTICDGGKNAGSPNKLHLHLKKALKHLRSIEQIGEDFTCPTGILGDHKMYSAIPYVLMPTEHIEQLKKAESRRLKNGITKKRFGRLSLTLKKKVEEKVINGGDEGKRKSSRLNKALETIELSDESESVTSGSDMVRSKTNSTTKDKRTAAWVNKNKLVNTFQRASGFKIRLSNNFKVDPKNIELKCDSSPVELNCNVCDKAFHSNCDYLAHLLWHKKPMSVVVKLARENLTDMIKAADFKTDESFMKTRTTIDDTKIDDIIHKYLGDDSKSNTVDNPNPLDGDESKNIDVLPALQIDENESASNGSVNENEVECAGDGSEKNNDRETACTPQNSESDVCDLSHQEENGSGVEATTDKNGQLETLEVEENSIAENTLEDEQQSEAGEQLNADLEDTSDAIMELDSKGKKKEDEVENDLEEDSGDDKTNCSESREENDEPDVIDCSAESNDVVDDENDNDKITNNIDELDDNLERKLAILHGSEEDLLNADKEEEEEEVVKIDDTNSNSAEEIIELNKNEDSDDEVMVLNECKIRGKDGITNNGTRNLSLKRKRSSSEESDTEDSKMKQARFESENQSDTEDITIEIPDE